MDALRSRLRSAGPLLLVVTVVATFTAVAAELAEGVRDGGDLAAYDPAVTGAVVAGRSALLTALARALTALGGVLSLSALTVLVVLALALRRRRRAAAVVAVTMVLSAALTIALKSVVGRDRPSADLVLGDLSATGAFPSGHALNSLVFFGLLAGLVLPRVRSHRAGVGVVAGWLAVSLGIGLSRIYLGYHWLTDVIAGWSLGLVVLAVAALAGHVLAPHEDEGAAPG